MIWLSSSIHAVAGPGSSGGVIWAGYDRDRLHGFGQDSDVQHPPHHARAGGGDGVTFTRAAELATVSLRVAPCVCVGGGLSSK